MDILVEDKCQMCLKVFTSKAEFKDHVDKEHKGHESIFPCAECFAFFKERRKLERHVAARHNDNNHFEQINCPYKECKAILSRKDHLRRHLAEIHRADPNDYIPPAKMSKAQKGDDWNNGYRRVIVPKSELKIKCVVSWCGYIARQRNHFIVHMDRVHNMKRESIKKLCLKLGNDSGDDDDWQGKEDEDDNGCEVIESSSDSDNDNDT